MSVMHINNRFGDTAVQWDKTDSKSVQSAMEKFNDLIKRGHVAFRTGENDKPGRINKFDPNAERVVVLQKFVGG